MKAINQKFTVVINGNKQFVIPVFQRDFCWTQLEFQQLWRDVNRASNKDTKDAHFMGSIVYIEDGLLGATFQRWLLIDGQQRMTTLTLLMIALRDHIRDRDWFGDTDDSPTTQKIDAYYLKNMQESGKRQYKLQLRRKDDATLRALIDGQGPSLNSNKHSNLLIEAYDFFRSELQSPTCSPDEIYRGVARLGVVDITLDRNIDDPQLVFESMNSTGIALRQSDLVRNYLLMGLDESEQTRYYEKYWQKIESLFRVSENSMDMFLRDYMALELELTQQVRLDHVYDEFKSFWIRNGEKPLSTLLEDMVQAASTYASFLGLQPVTHTRVAVAMSRMRSLNTTQGVLVMRLYDYNRKNLLADDEFVRALELIESYLLRRAVLGLQTRGYWSVFARIARDLTSQATFASLQVALARLRGSNRFPSDVEFRRGLEEHDLYGLRVCKHILDWLENAGYREPSPVQGFSIEHIMPQDVDGVLEWREMLGVDWRAIHEVWLHRLGNLTLTAYNSAYSNRPFEQKKTIPGGFQESAVRLNCDVRDQARWTAEEIMARGKRLANRALEIWPNHKADASAIQEADIHELRERAKTKNTENLEMDDNSRTLIDEILTSTRDFAEIIEVIEQKSVCCYGPEFFSELVPMKGWVRIILPLDFSEAEKPDGLTVHDASTWKFVPNRTQTSSNLLVDISTKGEIEAAAGMIRQALDRARQ